MPRLWVLNLDAEVELSGRVVTKAGQARTHEWAARVATLLPDGDIWIERFEGDAAGWEGAAWCPTPHAVAQLEARGARLPDVPPFEVLRSVNDRAFAFSLEALPGTRRITDATEIDVPEGARVWLRRGLGFAGRGVHRAVGPLTDADRAFARASLKFGTLFLEPQVEVLLDVALHAHTDGREGQLTVATLERGQWRGSRLADDAEVTQGERRQMRDTLLRVADALRAARYRGPFGIDGFRWRDAAGAVRFHPLTDINARYSMGWATGMGGW